MVYELMKLFMDDFSIVIDSSEKSLNHLQMVQ